MIVLDAQTHLPRGPSGSVFRVSVGTGGGTVGVGVGTIEKLLQVISEYNCTHSPLQRCLSGSVFGVAIGVDGGIADEGVGATRSRIN